MIYRQFKARMVEDFKNEWLELSSVDENMSIEEVTDAYGGDGLNALDKRIAGEIVTITENTYTHGETDYFEAIDNNFVIFPDLFEEIDEDKP